MPNPTKVRVSQMFEPTEGDVMPTEKLVSYVPASEFILATKRLSEAERLLGRTLAGMNKALKREIITFLEGPA